LWLLVEVLEAVITMLVAEVRAVLGLVLVLPLPQELLIRLQSVVVEQEAHPQELQQAGLIQFLAP
jgi:hypothetical protein